MPETTPMTREERERILAGLDVVDPYPEMARKLVRRFEATLSAAEADSRKRSWASWASSWAFSGIESFLVRAGQALTTGTPPARKDDLLNVIDALRAYVQHEPLCTAYLYPGIGKCQCGLDAVKARAQALSGACAT